MGTSSSSKGAGGSQPLVPSWADSEPGKPLPEAPARRFVGFRTQLGKFANGGGSDALSAAAKNYARTTTGGSGVGPRRYGSSYAAGSQVLSILGGPSSAPISSAPSAPSLEQLAGRPVSEAAQAIADAVSPPNADADRVRSAVIEAICEISEGDTFDPTDFSTESGILFVESFLTQTIFQDLVEQGGASWNKSDSLAAANAAEKALLEFVKTAVSVAVSALPSPEAAIDPNTSSAIMQDVVRRVWETWESDE